MRIVQFPFHGLPEPELRHEPRVGVDTGPLGLDLVQRPLDGDPVLVHQVGGHHRGAAGLAVETVDQDGALGLALADEGDGGGEVGEEIFAGQVSHLTRRGDLLGLE